jgi:hypothetical protein
MEAVASSLLKFNARRSGLQGKQRKNEPVYSGYFRSASALGTLVPGRRQQPGDPD